jgi:glycosyltransferase involved in cell wall biosynthesis
MVALYCTADKIGTVSGGGVVTLNELLALQKLGKTVGVDQSIVPPGPDPFVTDLRFEDHVRLLLTGSERYDLAHFYSGCFTKTVRRLRESGIKVTYTAAAHDRRESEREWRKLTGDYPFRHLTDEKLWIEYVGGYLDADLVICPSNLSKRIMESYGAKQVVVIPHGTDLPREVKPLPKRFTVGYLGQVGPDKGIIYLLQAWKKLNYPDARLLLAGRGTEDLVPIIRKYGGGNIQIMGFVRDVSDFYNSCTVYVQPSVCLLPGSVVIANDCPKAIDDLCVSDHVLSADGTYRRVIRPIKNQYSGTLVSLRTSGIDIPTRMTEAHRVLCIPRGLEARRANFDAKMRHWVEALRLHKEGGLGSVRIARRLGLNERTVAGWLYYGAKPRGKSANSSLKETVLLEKPRWVHAGRIEKGDIVVFPRIKENKPIGDLALPKRKFSGLCGNRTSPLPESVSPDADVLRLVGYYISEGCGTTRDVSFCFNSKERDYIEDVSRTIKTKFGLNVRKVSASFNHSTTVWVHSVLFSEWLRGLCGQGAYEKRMPSWALRLPQEQLIPILLGMWNGDGSVFLSSGFYHATYSTVSKVLAYQTFYALVKLGYAPHLYDEKRRGYSIKLSGPQVARFAHDVLGRDLPRQSRKRAINNTWIDDNYYYSRVTDVSRMEYEGTVFNLEVEGNPSYAAPFVVHNSEGFGIEVLEAMAHGRPVIVSSGAGAADVVKDAVDGFVVPPRDPDAISAKIDVFRGIGPWNPKEMGAQARIKAEQYSWDKVRQRYVEVWKDVVLASV